MEVIWIRISMTTCRFWSLQKVSVKNHHHPKCARLYFEIKHLTQRLRQCIHYLVASVWTFTSDCPVELTSVGDKREFGQVPSEVSRDWHTAQESINNMSPEAVGKETVPHKRHSLGKASWVTSGWWVKCYSFMSFMLFYACWCFLRAVFACMFGYNSLPRSHVPSAIRSCGHVQTIHGCRYGPPWVIMRCFVGLSFSSVNYNYTGTHTISMWKH